MIGQESRTAGRALTIFLTSTFAALIACVPSTRVHAQASHVEQLQETAIKCLGDIPKDVSEFRLHDSGGYRYIRSALVSYWMDQGKSVFLDSEGTTSRPMAALETSIDLVAIEFGKSASGSVERRAIVGIDYTLISPASNILVNQRCDMETSDTLTVDMARLLRDARYPATDVEPDSKNWFSGIIEPVVVLGAAAVGTYLLFSLRSERGDNQ